MVGELLEESCRSRTKRAEGYSGNGHIHAHDQRTLLIP